MEKATGANKVGGKKITFSDLNWFLKILAIYGIIELAMLVVGIIAFLTVAIGLFTW